MACPNEIELMNYSLGRSFDLRLRSHIPQCKRCSERLRKIEARLIEEARERCASGSPFVAKPAKRPVIAIKRN